MKKKEFKGGISLNIGKVKGTSKFNPKEVEKVVREIHKPLVSVKKGEKVKTTERIVKTTVLIPKSLHKKLKQRTLDLETSISQYFNKLLQADLKKSKG